MTDWTPQDDQLATDMRAAGFSFGAIAFRLNRTHVAVRCRIRYRQLSEEQKADESRLRHRGRQAEGSGKLITPTVGRVDVSNEVFDEVARRESEPRSLTAWAFGDPAPSRSALAKRQGVSA
jgi:hypothetical protein